MKWKDVKGYEGLYKVSDTGVVLSLARPGNWRGDHIMAGSHDTNGYRQVLLCKNGKSKTVKIHRLVANAFVENPNGYLEINHIDENKDNCAANNLEWCDRAYNVHYGSRTQKTKKKVAAYSKEGVLMGRFSGIRDACKIMGFAHAGNISRAVSGKNNSAYGFIWKEI